MGTLRSGLDELRAVDIRSLPDGELKDSLGEIARSSGILEAERARTVAEIERRGAYGADGHLSITSFVEHHLQSSWWEAARTVRVARALEEHPELREALAEGEVSPSAAAELASAREARPEAFSKD